MNQTLDTSANNTIDNKQSTNGMYDDPRYHCFSIASSQWNIKLRYLQKLVYNEFWINHDNLSK